MTHRICTIVEERGGEQALYDVDGEFVCKGVIYPADYRAVHCTAVTHRFGKLDAEDANKPWPELLSESWLEEL